MFSYLLYNSILLSSLVFGYLAEYANFKQFRFLARFIVFIGLFLPAALRYDVGYDYWSYSAIYTGIMDAGSAVEPGFLFLQEAGRSLNLDTQWIFVLSSFVMYFPIAFLIGRKSFFLIVTFYTLYLYLEGLSFVRQYLAVTFLIVGLYHYLYSCGKKKYLVYFFSSLLFHLSSIFYLLTLFIRNWKIKSSGVIWTIVIVGYIMFVKLALAEHAFTVVGLILPRYAAYADSSYNVDTELGSGVGVLLRLTIPFCVFLYRGRLLQANPRNNYLIWLNIAYVIVTYLTIEIAILGRLNDLFSFVLLFSVSGLLQMNSINKKVIIVLLLFFSLLLFEKNITHVYPYQSILP